MDFARPKQQSFNAQFNYVYSHGIFLGGQAADLLELFELLVAGQTFALQLGQGLYNLILKHREASQTLDRCDDG